MPQMTNRNLEVRQGTLVHFGSTVGLLWLGSALDLVFSIGGGFREEIYPFSVPSVCEGRRFTGVGC